MQINILKSNWKMRKNILQTYLLGVGLILLNSASFLSAGQAPKEPVRDGKLLQGEKWELFSYPSKADFYVSVKGNDNWSGNLSEPNSGNSDGPFLTIERAMKAVRDLKSKVYLPKGIPVETRYIGSPHPFGSGKDILVYIREGHYSLKQPLMFNPDDGGERVETNLPTGAFEYHKLKDYYVTFAAYPGENPVISGGTKVSGWVKGDKIWTAPFDADTVAMLIVNGKRQVLARTPDSGYLVPPVISKSTGELHFNKGDIMPWKEMDGNRIIMLLRWHTGINTIIKVDEKDGIATFRTPQEGVVIVPPRYYIENVKALMDTPGEWFFDKNKKELSYIPENGLNDPGQMDASIPKLSSLVEVVGKHGKPVRNLRIYGLTFEGAMAGKSAISYEFAHSCEFVGNNVRSCAGTGVTVNKGCYQTRILRNLFETLDNGGAYVIGSQNPADGREIIREIDISYNKFFDCGGNSIFATNTLMTSITHNYITKTRGRYGIDVGGWSNQEEAIDGGYTVEYNHLDDVQLDADDSGAIKTAGMTFNSAVRRNLIHNVHAGFFNDNVGFWFDNMSQGWTTEENIFYALEQGEMKLCAALPEDNTYQNNFKIEAPVNPPETIIEAAPEFVSGNLKVESGTKSPSGAFEAGSIIRISSDVYNNGGTGIAPVDLYLDGKVYSKKLMPVIKGNSRRIEFEIRIYEAGEHTLAIGTTPYQSIQVEGKKPSVVFEDLKISDIRMLNGEKVKVTATARNLTSSIQKTTSSLFLDNREIENHPVELKENESIAISFEIAPPPGNHRIRVGNSNEKTLDVFESRSIDISRMEIKKYCSAKAKPYEIEADNKANRFKITAGGSDFFHAEDSYAAAYIKGIKGDFVATVRISQFGNRTHEWFRSGLFVRNDISKSFDAQPGSKGSVLVFGTPGRAGIEYDEFANGCMHKASSQNLPENSKTPIYLKMVRHGNSFSGYISLDGKNWIIERRSVDIPGIAESVDLGLAAGGPDKKQYAVEFSDWKIEVAK
jgi:regulation of enolase protein 1 (concanavalin A-like superfamily)